MGRPHPEPDDDPTDEHLEEDGELDDPEAPNESDMDDGDDDEPEGVPCPYCGQTISELAQWCPKCENYISREDAPLRSSHPRWVVWTAIAVLASLAIGGAFALRWW